MRATFTVLHRWAGLITAAFLFISGITGAVVSWDHALDEWINADFYTARSDQPPKPAVEIAKMIEARDPRVRVINMLQRFLRENERSRLVVVFDAPGRTFRDELFA